MIIVMMGVSGVGKTTIGRLLALKRGWEFADADDFHSAANVEKMRNRIPLTESDRGPWLEALRGFIASRISAGKDLVLACSALRGSYRDRLRVGPEVRFIYLRGPVALLHSRLHERVGHYMTEEMLASQIATLEEPGDAVVVEVDQTPEEIVKEIRAKLGLTRELQQE